VVVVVVMVVGGVEMIEGGDDDVIWCDLRCDDFLLISFCRVIKYNVFDCELFRRLF